MRGTTWARYAGRVTSSSGSSTGPLALYHELWLEGRAPDLERFCAHFPEEPALVERIRAIAELRAELQQLAGEVRPAEAPPEEIAGFRLLRPLAHGGMGSVWLAEQQEPRRSCALKLLVPLSKLQLQRFRREADLTARLKHPAIATVYAFGVAGEIAYLASELVAGFTLRELLNAADLATADRPDEWLADLVRRMACGAAAGGRSTAHSPVGIAIDLGAQVAEALAHAHDQGVIHRDVKPSNIMVTVDGNAKLIDFGIAVPIEEDAHLTRTGVFVGSHAYAAPEQLKGEHHRVGPWSDTYATCATLFEMVTQRPPFGFAELGERLARADDPPPDGPRALNPRVPPALDALLRRGLDPRPERRFRDGQELAEALRHCPRRTPLVPWVPFHRWRRWLPRSLAQLVAGVMTVAAVVLSVLYAGSVRELELRRDESRAIRLTSAYEMLNHILHQREESFATCIAHNPPAMRRPVGPRSLRVALTVLSGRVLNVRVLQQPVWLDWSTRTCLVDAFAALGLPGVGTAQAITIEAEVELPRPPVIEPLRLNGAGGSPAEER